MFWRQDYLQTIKITVMIKKVLLICAVAVSTMCLSFTAFAPAVQNSVSGHVYDQSSTSTTLSGIVVEEIVNNQVVSTTHTNDAGYFSLQVKSSTPELRFSDPDYQEFSTKSVSFDLRDDCSNVSVYMSRE